MSTEGAKQARRVRMREFSVDPIEIPERRHRRPVTSLQALMEAAPHQEPELSDEDVNPLMDIVREAFGSLGSHDRMLVEAVVFERASFRELERRWQIPKTTIHRWYVAVILELRAALIEYPEIVQFLDGMDDNTMEEA